MSSVEITAGTVEPLEVYVQKASDGTALTGSTNLRVEIRRAADDYFLDFADGTFKASGWTTKRGTLTEVSSSNAPGWYKYSSGIDTTGWSSGSYFVAFLEITTTLSLGQPNFASGEIKIVTATAAALSARLPAALDDGYMSAKVQAVANDAITAVQSGLATFSALSSVATAVSALPSASSNASAVWGAVSRTLTGIGSSGIASQSSVDALPTAGSVADAVCDELLSGHTISGSVGEALGRVDVAVSSRLATASYSAPPSAASIASQVWSTALPGAFSAGSGGFLVGTYLDAAVSSRLATSGYTAPPSASTIATQILGAAVPGAFASGSLGYVIGTNLDIVLSSRLDLAVSSRLAAASYTAPPTASQNAAATWQTAVPGSFTSGQAGNVLTTLATASAVAALPTADANAIALLNKALASFSTAGTVGKALTDAATAGGADATTIANAVWAAVLSAPDPNSAGLFLKRLFQLAFNHQRLTSAGGGTFELYDDDGTTLLMSGPVRDKSAGPVAIPDTSPARRGPIEET